MLDDEPTTDTPTTEPAAAPRRSRRRAASRPAGPPAEAPTAPAASAAAPVEPAGSPGEAPTAKPATAKKTAAKSATAKKAAARKSTAKSATVKSATAKSATARKTTAKKTTTAKQEEAEHAAASVEPEAAAPEPATAEPAPAKAPARRSRKKAEPATALLFQAPEAVEVPPTPATPAEPATGTGEAAVEDSDETEEGAPGARRRRRRGGRGRRGRGAGEGAAEGEAGEAGEDGSDAEASEAAPHESEGDGEDAGGSSRRRRRRRRRGGGGEDAEDGQTTPDDPERTVVHVRQPRAKKAKESDSISSVKGSTRLEAKKQRRREGREQGRRRPPVLTEAEFLARREAVDRVMVVRQIDERTQIAVLEDGVLVEHYVARATTSSMVGNVYLGRVQNVLPSMEAAFVEVGRGRNAVLYAGEVNWDAAGLDGQPKRIEHAMKSGDSVLVQVTKDPIGHKGARLTAQVSLPGRYLVYVPDGSMTGISRKLPDTERTRLKGILKRIVPDDAGVIVRTAAEGASEEELQRDVSRLSAQWADIAAKAKSASAPALLYEEPDLTIRVVRDIFNEDFNRLVVSGSDAWDTVEPYVRHVAPDLADRLQRWTDTDDVFAAHRIDEQLAKALDRKVWLPSGGYLIIDSTEAMIVVDVNTGKFTGQGGNLEETVTKNNLEAAEEIVRQLRLRDIGGIVVIDFIDMVLESNRELVLRRLLECLGRDRTKHQVAEVTSLGLVQMTRKRVGQGLLDAFSTVCESCNGRGRHVHLEPVEPKREQKAEAKRGEGRRSRKTAAATPAAAEAGADDATKAALAAVAGAAGKGRGDDEPAPAADEPAPV